MDRQGCPSTVASLEGDISSEYVSKFVLTSGFHIWHIHYQCSVLAPDLCYVLTHANKL